MPGEEKDFDPASVFSDGRDSLSRIEDSSDEERRATEEVATATNVDQLKEIVAALVNIRTSQGVQPAADIVRRIDQVRNGHRLINFVTRTHGISAKLASLLSADKIYQKRVLNKKD